MTSRNGRTISLCMIVRDEAELLPGCLAAAQGVWDELVVVDTGSTDETRAIAERFGARVVSFAWVDDFAAARNVALAEATCDWILVLDADELLSAEAKTGLLRVADDWAAGAATVVIKNQLPHGHRREARLLRFFRAHPSIRFTHRIHEDASAPVLARLASTGQALVAVDGRVEHLGYARERMAQRGKRDRDRRLLDQALAEDGDDLYAWFKLLEQARFWRDEAEGARAAKGAVEAMGRLDPAALAGLHFGGELVAMLAWAAPGSERARLAVLEAWFARVKPSAALHLARGELRELVGEPSAAAQSYLRALTFKDAPGGLEVATVRPLMGLARLAIAAGDLEEAGARVREALALNSDDVEALTAAVVLASATGGEQAVQALLRSWGSRPDLHAALGEAALLQGQTQRAVHELEEASRCSADARVQLRLAQALLADGRVAAARDLAERLATALPEAVLGVLVCDLIEGVDSALELPLSQREADAAMRDWVRMLQQRSAAPLLSRLRAVVPAVEQFFPWLPEFVGVQPGGR
mgnify:CR=1 FL=1